ncbi:MAG: hypothetical protein AB7N80_03340 [Bdellovibrionales bacterium]
MKSVLLNASLLIPIAAFKVLKAALLALAMIAAVQATAERMDESTHSMIIGKLEGALKFLSKNSKERTSITLRLADLYADRARLQVLAKNEGNCGACPDGKQDRERAVTLYKSVIDSLDRDNQGLALLQLAHLQTLLNLTKDATSTLERASNQKRYHFSTTSHARGNLGELKFRQANYAGAEKDFAYALSNKEVPNAGFLTYRLAWSQLNQGRVQQATATLIHLLQTPELLTVENQAGSVFDQSFHDDITKDLVIFLARGEVGQKEIDLLLSLSPEKLRRDNMYALANELERLGKKYSATLAWAAYDEEGDNTPLDSVEKQIRVAQLQWDMGRKTQALEEYAKATELWRKKGCKGDKCDELSKRFKNFVINWNKTEKDQPSQACLEAYKTYLKVFSQDAEMFFKAATVADQTKNSKDAALLYAQAAQLARERKNQDKANKELLEASLLKYIEAAELSKDKTTRLNAYNTYLEMNPAGAKALDVRYQKAQVTYEMGKSQAAFDQFMSIATEKASDQRALRTKAADLSLDTLASMKNDQKIYETTAQLISLYPHRATEYGKVQRQAAIQMAAAALNNKSSSQGTLESESARLAKIEMKKANREDQLLIYKNRIALGERLKDLSQVNVAAQGLLSVPGLKNADREFALGRMAWVAELRLDFKTALKVTRQMDMPHLNKDDRHLRLAMLSELAGQNPDREYRIALKATHSQDKALGIRATLVRLAKNPWRAIKEHQSQLRKQPALLSSLVVEAYAKTGDEGAARRALKDSSLRHSSLAQLFETRELLTQWRNTDRQLARHQIYSGSDSILQRSLSKRIELLNKQDRLGRAAIKQNDWLGQLAVLMTIERENRRLHSDLLRLPIPKKLKGAQREQYLTLLKSQAQNFKIKADQAGDKARDFWNNSHALNKFESAFHSAQGHTRSLIKHNLNLVAKVADNSDKRRIENIVNSSENRPSVQDVAKAEIRLKQDPFDTGHVSELKRLAEKRGQVTMVAYLDARLSQMRKGVQ